MRTRVWISTAVSFLPLVIIAGRAVAQQSIVMDFERYVFENSSVNYVAHEVIEDGFRITHGENEPTPFAVYGTLSERFAGSIALQGGNVNGLIRLESVNGELFDLRSIDVAMLNGGGMVRVELTGFVEGGGVVEQTIVHEDEGLPLELVTYEVEGFTNLRKVQWRQIAPHHQFDNVTVAYSTGYRIIGEGFCPGDYTISWFGAQPRRVQAMVFGRQRGAFTIPNGLPCAGTVLGVSGGVRIVDPPGFFSTGETGEGAITGGVGTAACGGILQLVEGGSCGVTNILALE